MQRQHATILPTALAILCFLSISKIGLNAQTVQFTSDDFDPGDEFAGAVAVSGNTDIVGAIGAGDMGALSGSAYLFDVATGNQLFKLFPDDAAAGYLFGASVAISGNSAIVGANGDDGGTGSAYLFDVTTGMQFAKLAASDAAANDAFGRSVAISGATAIVGAPAADGSAGAAYLFNAITGSEIFELMATDASVNDTFGESVAIDGDTAVVGANGDNDGAGSSYLFDVTTGNQLFKLTGSDAAALDNFGTSVSISSGLVIVGANGNDDAGDFSGSAYFFDADTGSQLAKLAASDAEAGDAFGSSVSASGNNFIVGAPGSGDAADTSSVYTFVIPLPSSAWMGLSVLGGLAVVRLRRALNHRA
jgi:outer membrane protein assembly factor BamB